MHRALRPGPPQIARVPSRFGEAPPAGSFAARGVKQVGRHPVHHAFRNRWGWLMAVNRDKPDRWKPDIALSVDMYNDRFMNFAPKAFRETRIETTKAVEATLHATGNLTNVRPEVLRDHPQVLSTLRMSTCPPPAVDRLIGLSGVPPRLVNFRSSCGVDKRPRSRRRGPSLPLPTSRRPSADCRARSARRVHAPSPPRNSARSSSASKSAYASSMRQRPPPRLRPPSPPPPS